MPLTLADWDRLGRDVPCIVNLKPSGAFLMEEFHDAGGFPVVLRTLIEAGLVDGTAPTVTGGTLAETCAAAPQLPPRRDPPARRPGPAPGRHRRPARQPRPRRCGHQAVRRHAVPAAPPRPCGRVREHRALPRPHRRPRARRRRHLDPGPQGLRPARLPRHARMRQHGPAAQAAAPGRHRHGPHLRRPHERHRLRHRRPPRRPRKRGRRPARPGPATATRSSSTCRPPPRAPGRRGRASPPPRRHGSRRPRRARAAMSACSTTMCCRRTRAATSTSCWASGPASCTGEHTEAGSRLPHHGALQPPTGAFQLPTSCAVPLGSKPAAIFPGLA